MGIHFSGGKPPQPGGPRHFVPKVMEAKMLTIWRLNIKPDAVEGVDPRRFCFEKGILGIGWPVDADGPLDWDTYINLGEKEYQGDGHKAWLAAANAIGNMAINDLCWTRDADGSYYLGRIVGEWEYRSTAEYRNADIVNLRPCEWCPTGGLDSVPGKVLNSFRPPSTVQAVRDDSSNIYSRVKYNQLIGSTHYDLPVEKNLDLLALVSPEDCEDIVAIYLQEKLGYRFIPSSHRSDTVKTEFVLKTAEGKQAYVQVKQGNIDLVMDEFKQNADAPRDWYLFTTKGRYIGKEYDGLHCLNADDMRKFALENRNLMSNRVQTWMDFVNGVQ